MARHQFEGHEADEGIDVESLLDRRPALFGIGLETRRLQGSQVAVIVGALAGILFEIDVDVLHEAAVVEVAGRIAEVAFEERLIEALLQNVQAEVAIVQPDASVSHSRGRYLRVAAQVRAQPLAQVRLVLYRVVEMELFHRVESLILLMLVHVERECGAIVEFAKAAGGSFELDGNVGVGRLAVGGRLDQFALGVAASVLTQLLRLRLFQLDLELRDDAVVEEFVASVTRRRCGNFGLDRRLRRFDDGLLARQQAEQTTATQADPN